MRSFPAAFIPFVSMCLVCDHFLQVSTQAEETLQTLRCEMSSDFPLHNGESLSQFQFHSCFCFPTKLGHPFFLKDLATHKPNLNQENPSTPTPWCPPNEARFPCCFGGGQRWDAKALGASAGRPWSTTTTLRGLGLGPSRWLVGSESSREEMGATPKLVGEFPHWLKNLGFMQPIVLRS